MEYRLEKPTAAQLEWLWSDDAGCSMDSYEDYVIISEDDEDQLKAVIDEVNSIKE